MSTSTPLSVTIEEAVARMINMDYIPTGFTLIEMTGAFLEEAEVEHHNATIDHLPTDQIAALQIHMDACAARHSLAQSLTGALRNEINNPEGLIVVLNDESCIEQQLTLESVINWADEKYGICILEWLHTGDNTQGSNQYASWEDVTIKIYKDYRMAYSIGNGPFNKSSFQKIGLMGIRKNKPNLLGGILIGLSLGKKFPTGKAPENKDAAPICKLRRALERLTNLSSDPFFPINEVDGWKPRFTLIDDRRNADERAKKRAKHVSLDDTRNHDIGNVDTADSEDDNVETRNYENEKDAAGDWLDKKR